MFKFDLNNYADQAAPIREALDLLKKDGWADAENGKHYLGDTGIFVNVFEYNSKKQEEATWEAHRKYADVQFMLRGEELMEYADISHLQLAPYIEERDFIACEGPAEKTVPMNVNTGYIIFPEDGHKPGISPDGSCAFVKRACAKIPMDLLK